MNVLKSCLLFCFLLSLVCVNVLGQENQTVNNGATTKAANFPVSVGCFYTWTNDRPGIGLPISGIGDIAAFTAVNNGPLPIVATIIATPVARGFAYVASQDKHYLMAISTETHGVAARVAIGAETWGVAVGANGSRVYTANWASESVSVINTLDHTLIATIPVNGDPYGIAASPDGKWVYVTRVNATSNASISVINTTTNKVTGVIEGVSNPQGIVVSPDSKHIYVISNGGGFYSINATDLSVEWGKAVGSGIGISVSPDGGMAYVANRNNNQVSFINLNTRTVEVFPVASDPFGTALSPDGSILYVAVAYAKSIAVFNTVTKQHINDIPVPNYPYGISISPDGRELYVNTQSDDGVVVVNTATNNLTMVPDVGTNLMAIGEFVTATETCTATPVTFTITVNPTPAITANGTFSDFNTNYGVASASQSFNVSAVNLAEGILVTSPDGFEVSADNVNFHNSITIGAAGVVPPLQVHVRLSPTANAGSHNGDIVLSSSGASQKVSIPFGNIAPSHLTISTEPRYKNYGEVLLNETGSINFKIINGTLYNGNTITGVNLTYGAGANATDRAGIYSGLIMISGAVGINGFLPSNYYFDYFYADIIVQKAPLRIIAEEVRKTTSASLSSGSTSASFTTEGLKNAETVGNVIVNYGDGADANSMVGTYTGSVMLSEAGGGSFNADNYLITYVPANIIVTEGPSISANGNLPDFTSVYGTSSSSASFSVSGSNLSAGIMVKPPTGLEISADGINFSNTLTTSGNGAGTVVYIRLASNMPVGLYPGEILLSSPGADDGSVPTKNNEVTPAMLTISADDKTKFAGNSNPIFTVSYSGFKNNDGQGSLVTLPVISTTATSSSPAGSYPIILSGAASPNYTFLYVPGVLTVTESPRAMQIPNTFTPNGDAINDTWSIPALTGYNKCVIDIYNRYGNVVMHSIGYAKPWGGALNGRELPAGVYYYVIDLKLKADVKLSGYVTIIR